MSSELHGAGPKKKKSKESKENREKSLITFNLLLNFIKEATELYGEKYKNLRLYNRILEKTKISNNEAIKKNIALFEKFCQTNREAIHQQNFSAFSEQTIKYSEKIVLNIHTLFCLADEENRKVLWQYVLSIAALLDPVGKAREILKNMKAKPDEKSTGKEADFLASLIDKVEKNIKSDATPQEAMNAIFTSGFMGDVMNSFQTESGGMDFGKLMGMAQGMISGLSEQAGNDPQASTMLNGVSNMLGTMTTSAENGTPPDLTGMLGMVGSLMGNMATAPPPPSE